MIEVQKHKVVLITYVWPEPLSSAAGLRDMNLIDSILWAGWDLIVASPSVQNSYSDQLIQRGIRIHGVHANDPEFDLWIKSEAPSLVIFDRFVIEEQFGWRVQENCPDAVRVLDTQDLHFLRRTRAKAIQIGKSEVGKVSLVSEALEVGSKEFMNEDTFREIASLYRCDGIFVLSRFEYDLLISQFNFSRDVLSLSRFQYPDPVPTPGFEDRDHFMMIGNFRHAPNEDGVRWLIHEIWPLIRRRLPNVSLDIYGAYPSKEMMALTSKKEGIFVRGPISDHLEVLRSHRVNLAPLRFGAGIKGKISDGWWAGTPVVATSIGAEGMSDSYSFGGLIADSAEDFAEAAVRLFQEEKEWAAQQQSGIQLIQALYSLEINRAELVHFLAFLLSNRGELRSHNWLGAMLDYHSMRSTRYFSKWIEEKSKRLGNNVSLN
jgi:glycosyltransferase involved in cell wall biosynthesis